MDNIYDLIIIGAGPAGLSAGLYASRMNVNTLIIEKGIAGGQLNETEQIDNYIGSKTTNAQELASFMVEDASKYGANLKEFVEVLNIKKENNLFNIETTDGTYYSYSLILATGTSHNQLNVPNHDDLLGKGLSYCAVCDSPFYKDKNVVVVGGGDNALESAILLSEWANNVYIVHRRSDFRAKPYLVEEAKNNTKITFVLNEEVDDIVEDANTTYNIKFKNGSSLLEISGIFPCIGSIPNYDFMKNILNSDTNKVENYIVPGYNGNYRKGFYDNLEYIEGVFMAGDMIHPRHRQVSIAVNDGCVAALESYQYLNKIKSSF